MSHRVATHLAPTPRAPRWLRALVALLAVAAVAGVATTVWALRNGGGPGALAPAPAEESATTEVLVPKITVGTITGTLAEPAAAEVADQVSEVVSDYLAWAYLGDYPRTDWSSAPPGFSALAARGYQRDARRLPGLTNQALGATVESVVPTDESIQVDVFAPKGELSGATAHYRLRFTTESASGSAALTAQGRLVLSPVGTGWQVVGYYAEEAR